MAELSSELDCDTVSEEKITSEFEAWSLSDEEAISLNKNYVLKISTSGNNKVGILSSDSTCYIYAYGDSKLKRIQKYKNKDVKVSDVKISPQNDNLLYASSSDGCIRLWDERSGDKCVSVYQENPETKESTKPILSFDVSCKDRVLCGGTEATDGDAFMLFWDVRKTDLMGAYWNSHTDDIVQVQFNKTKNDHLATAGVDGLINTFDITELNEDDALQFSLNTECAVDRLCWISHDAVACITDNVDIQLWDIETGDQLIAYSREDITKTLKRKVVDDCYVIDVYQSTTGVISVLGGSYSNNGNCLRSIDIHPDEKKLKPLSNYEGNKQIIRSSIYDEKNNVVITGGEAGILSLWKKGPPQSPTQTAQTRRGKISSGTEKLKIHKEKPY